MIPVPINLFFCLNHLSNDVSLIRFNEFNTIRGGKLQYPWIEPSDILPPKITYALYTASYLWKWLHTYVYILGFFLSLICECKYQWHRNSFPSFPSLWQVPGESIVPIKIQLLLLQINFRVNSSSLNQRAASRKDYFFPLLLKHTWLRLPHLKISLGLANPFRHQ